MRSRRPPSLRAAEAAEFSICQSSKPSYNWRAVALRVLILPDKFKGTLTAHAAASAIAAGWRHARPQDRLDLLPMSDGGDGFGEVIGRMMGGKLRRVRTVDAAHRPIQAQWWFAASGTAVIEAAQVNGLALMSPGKYHPFDLDALGLAAVLEAAQRRGAKRAIVGIGGSATNDAGFGMARGLGWRFCDAQGRELDQWPKLANLARIHRPGRPLNIKLTAAVDVKNVLLGAAGCSRVYGPQKGLRPQDFALAEASLRRLANVLKRQFGLDFAKVPGAGAAGGLGFGLMSFAGAKIESGFDIFASAACLAECIAASDLVITGEGRIDRQTHMGKGVGRIASLCARLKVPCIGLSGAFEPSVCETPLFAKTAALTELTTVESALARPAFFLRRLARQMALSMLG